MKVFLLLETVKFLWNISIHLHNAMRVLDWNTAVPISIIIVQLNQMYCCYIFLFINVFQFAARNFPFFSHFK